MLDEGLLARRGFRLLAAALLVVLVLGGEELVARAVELLPELLVVAAAGGGGLLPAVHQGLHALAAVTEVALGEHCLGLGDELLLGGLALGLLLLAAGVELVAGAVEGLPELGLAGDVPGTNLAPLLHEVVHPLRVGAAPVARLGDLLCLVGELGLVGEVGLEGRQGLVVLVAAEAVVGAAAGLARVLPGEDLPGAVDLDAQPAAVAVGLALGVGQLARAVVGVVEDLGDAGARGLMEFDGGLRVLVAEIGDCLPNGHESSWGQGSACRQDYATDLQSRMAVRATFSRERLVDCVGIDANRQLASNRNANRQLAYIKIINHLPASIRVIAGRWFSTPTASWRQIWP